MKIVELRVSNFARLTALAIRPDSAIVPITGANSEGKTSVLKSIWTALKGRTAAPPRPIHEGAEEAIIKLDLGELKIIRKFSRDKAGEITTDLTVMDNGGGRISRKPQAVIDALLADLSFDPLAFSKMKPEDQYVRLRSLVPGVDFDRIARERQAAYDDRTRANRDAKEESTIASNISLPEGPEPEAVDVSSLMKSLSAADAANTERARYEARINEHKTRLERMREELVEAEERVETLGARIIQVETDLPEMEVNLPAEIVTQPIREKIASAQRIDTVRRLFQSQRDHRQKAEDAAELSENLSKSIAALDRKVVDAISQAKLPGGLSINPTERIVMIDGLPFASAGTAERIIASAKVAMALSPELRVMLIDEGSELDRAHMEALAKVAGDSDYQVWVARVEEGETASGFRIEDGANAARGAISKELVERSKGARK